MCGCGFGWVRGCVGAFAPMIEWCCVSSLNDVLFEGFSVCCYVCSNIDLLFEGADVLLTHNASNLRAIQLQKF